MIKLYNINSAIQKWSWNQKVKIMKINQNLKTLSKSLQIWLIDSKNKRMRCKLIFKWKKIKSNITYKRYKILNNQTQD